MNPEHHTRPEHLGEALGTDFFSVRDQLSPEQWELFLATRRFVDQEVLPVAADYWERGEVAWPLIRKLPELGIVGGEINGYGCPGMSPMAAGLVQMELNRGDGSLGVFYVVHSSLAMKAIADYGSPSQCQRWLPAMAKMELIGAFALTEPDHGSDSIALETTARRHGDHWILNGTKRWIGNASAADVMITWARDAESGEVLAFVVSKDAQGCSCEVISSKGSVRAVWQCEVILDGVRVAEADRLAGASGFADTARLLAATRGSCAWMALGHATGAYDAALRYTRARQQFGTPLAGFQLVQYRLARMLAELTGMQLYCMQIGHLAEAGRLSPRWPGWRR
jgi:glutaryl-CoA dehydrogenase